MRGNFAACKAIIHINCFQYYASVPHLVTGCPPLELPADVTRLVTSGTGFPLPVVPTISVSASLTSSWSLSPPSLWMSARWLCRFSRADNRFFISGAPGPWPLAEVSLRGEARLMELDLRLLTEAEAGPGNSELVEQEEKEELLCFL